LMATLRTGTPAPAPSLVRVASARPFVPETPVRGRPVHGDLPMPEERPYSLGNSQADYASINATSDMSASSRARSANRTPDNPREVSYEDDARYSSAYRPAAAYAPVDPEGPREILSGRGLY
jgi:rare lipoprotein A